MDYLKVWTSFRLTISMLDDAEKGRLFDAMLMYAETGEEPTEFIGNERFLWIAAKQDIDRTAQRCEALRANASKGGFAKSRNRQALANDSKACQELANDSKEEQAEAKVSCNIKKSKEKKSNGIINPLFARFWAEYPRHNNKPMAVKAFEKINPDEELLAKMLDAIRKQKQTAQWQENEGQFIPYPSTWLNQRRWEDEVKTSTQQGKRVAAQDYSQRDYDSIQNDIEERQRKHIEERLRAAQ